MLQKTLFIAVACCINVTSSDIRSYSLHLAGGTLKVSGSYLASNIHTNFKERFLTSVQRCIDENSGCSFSQRFVFQSNTCTAIQNDQASEKSSVIGSATSVIVTTPSIAKQDVQTIPALILNATRKPQMATIANGLTELPFDTPQEGTNVSLLAKITLTSETFGSSSSASQFETHAPSSSETVAKTAVAMHLTNQKSLPFVSTSAFLDGGTPGSSGNFISNEYPTHTTFSSGSFVSGVRSRSSSGDINPSLEAVTEQNHVSLSALPSSTTATDRTSERSSGHELQNDTSTRSIVSSISTQLHLDSQSPYSVQTTLTQSETSSLWSETVLKVEPTTCSKLNATAGKPKLAILQKIPGNFSNISLITCGVAGVYAASADGSVYFRKGTNGSYGVVGDAWMSYGRVGNVTAIVSTKMTCLIYNSTGSFLKWFIPSSNWEVDTIFGNFKYVAINNPKSTAFFGLTTHVTLALGSPKNNTWIMTVCDTQPLSTIAFGAAGLWAVTIQGTVHYLNNSRETEAHCGSDWIETTGQFEKVAVGKQLVLAIAKNGSLYGRSSLSDRNPSGTNWSLMTVDVNITDIAVSATDLTWLVSDAGETYAIANLQALL